MNFYLEFEKIIRYRKNQFCRNMFKQKIFIQKEDEIMHYLVKEITLDFQININFEVIQFF